MKIAKIMNNNVVSALDEGTREIIVLGKGIGFQKHNGDLIDEVKVEKIFRLSEPARSKFEKLVEEIPYEYVSYTDEIVREATETLGMELNKNIYITLTDHLHFAIERYRRNITFQNALLWEIKRFYSREYEVGLKAVELLKEREGVALSVDEAAFIALHIVNAEMDINLSRTLSVPGMIKDLLNIVRYTFHVDLDEESLSYERFVTHLKFFIQRTLKRQCYPTEELELYELYRKKAPKSYECAKKIKKYMEEKTDTEVTDEEMMYLTVHISRVIKETGAEAGAEA
ncbi:MAG: PRD domain-containing protein [Lachnospiraceae bacterium]|nr:PRD domain-containing protein [Lachnospiraceae bacterium]